MQQSQQSLPNILTETERTQLRQAFFSGAGPLGIATLGLRGIVYFLGGHFESTLPIRLWNVLGELWVVVLLGIAFLLGRWRVKEAGLLRESASVEVWSRTPRSYAPNGSQELISQRSLWQLAMVLLLIGILVPIFSYLWSHAKNLQGAYLAALLCSIPGLLCLVGLLRFFSKASQTLASLGTNGVTFGERQVLWEHIVSAEVTHTPLFLGHDTQLTFRLTNTEGQLHVGKLTSDPTQAFCRME